MFHSNYSVPWKIELQSLIYMLEKKPKFLITPLLFFKESKMLNYAVKTSKDEQLSALEVRKHHSPGIWC